MGDLYEPLAPMDSQPPPPPPCGPSKVASKESAKGSKVFSENVNGNTAMSAVTDTQFGGANGQSAYSVQPGTAGTTKRKADGGLNKIGTARLDQLLYKENLINQILEKRISNRKLAFEIATQWNAFKEKLCEYIKASKESLSKESKDSKVFSENVNGNTAMSAVSDTQFGGADRQSAYSAQPETAVTTKTKHDGGTNDSDSAQQLYKETLIVEILELRCKHREMVAELAQSTNEYKEMLEEIEKLTRK